MTAEIRVAAAIAAVLAFAHAAHAEELHKEGLSNSGVRLTYEATALPSGHLQIDVTLECKQNALDPLYGAGAVAVVNKKANPVDVQKNTLVCNAKGNADRVPVSGKGTGKIVIPGATPADIGKTIFVVGRVDRGKSPKTEVIEKKAGEAMQKELDKLLAN